MNVEVILDDVPEPLARFLFQRAANKRHALKKSDSNWVSIFKVAGRWYAVVIDFDAAKARVLLGDRAADFMRPGEGWRTYDARVADDGQHRVRMDYPTG